MGLHANNLSGPVPHEFGHLTGLTYLHLGGNNLTGPLPSSLTNLRQLFVLDITGNAGLCAPADAEFQDWLLTVEDFRGPTCTAGTQCRSVSDEQPILAAIDPMAAHCESCARVLQHQPNRSLPYLR